MLITILSTAFVLGILIFVHELGHFWAARKVGIKVLTFSLGFGPKLVGFRRGGTMYKISAVPFGGYVKMAGEEAFEDGYTAKPGDYMAAPWWGRVLMAFAGPGANIVAAFVLLCLVGVLGVRLPDFAPLVGSVDKGGQAETAGISAGDHIVSLQGQAVKTWHQLDVIWPESGKTTAPEHLSMVLSRGGEELTVTVPSGKKEEFLSAMAPAIEPELGEVMPGAPAYQAGMQKGDRVLSIDGKPVATWDEMRSIIYANPEREVKLQVRRGPDTLSINITPMSQQLPGQGTVGVIGISPPSYGSYLVRWPVHQAVFLGAANTITATVRTYGFLVQLATRPKAASQQLGGFVMIGQMAGQSAKKGLSDLLQLMAVLSVSLFVLNLLPLPVLDGGVILFSVIEGLRKKPLPNKAQAAIQQVGVTILLLLVAYTLFNDFSRIVGRRQALKGKPAIEQRVD
jgi:regulator of sigma E protease